MVYKSMVLTVCSLEPCEVPKIIAGNFQSKNYIHKNTKLLFVLSTVLTFDMMVQKQWWVKQQW